MLILATRQVLKQRRELPSLSEYKITGLKKSKAETIESDIVKKGQKITKTSSKQLKIIL